MHSLDKLTKLLTEQGVPFSVNEPMCRHTTFLVGGPAAVFIEPADTQQITAAQRLCREQGVQLLPIGRGSNLLVADSGLPFAVLRLGDSYSGATRTGDLTLEVRSGTRLSVLCRQTATEGLSGLEFAYGIPGNVGGCVYMNAGAYNGEMKDVVTAVTFLDENGVQHTLQGDALEFSYRHSYFTGKCYIILSVTMEFGQDDPVAIKAAMDDFMQRRREKQPLEYGSAGSTFKRPEGAYASALIDQCGLKGYRVGGAQVSEKHAGFVITDGTATTADVLAVMNHICAVVKEKTGFLLQPEVQLLP